MKKSLLLSVLILMRASVFASSIPWESEPVVSTVVFTPGSRKNFIDPDQDEPAQKESVFKKNLGVFLNLAPAGGSWFKSSENGIDADWVFNLGLDMTFTAPFLTGVRLDYSYIEYEGRPALDVYRACVMAGYETKTNPTIRADLFYGLAILECNDIVSACQAFGAGVKIGATKDDFSFAVGCDFTIIPQRGRDDYMMTMLSPYISIGGWF